MTQVLDSFVLEFALDHRQFSRDQREIMDDLRRTNEEALKQANEIESHAKKTFDVLSDMRREALTALGIFFGGRAVGEFVRHITSLDAATGRLATTIGMSAEETSAWQGAIKQAGGTAEGANSALSGLSSEMSRFQLTGQSAMLPVLSRLGISLYDQNRKLKTSGQLWLELSKAVQGMDAREATAFLQMIPGATQDMINFALMGPKSMQEYIAAARKAGVTTAESAAAARDYQRAIEQLDASSSNLGRTLVTAVAPAISTVANSLAGLLQSWSGRETSATGKGSRESLVQRFGSPRRILEWLGDHSPIEGDKEYTEGLATKWYGPKGADEGSEANHSLARRTMAMIQSSRPNTGSSNWDNFLHGLSYLETNQRDIGNSTSSAQGYFQFLKGTSQKARAAGLQDPSVGSYNDQASATMSYIKKFYPGAASAIDKGEFDKAIPALRGEWPSLPGGIQPQNMSRYSKFGAILSGGAAGGKAVTVNVGGVTVNTSSGNGDGIASDIEGSLRRSLTAGAANYGPQ